MWFRGAAIGHKIFQKTIDPKPDWVYIQECHPLRLIAQSGWVAPFCSLPHQSLEPRFSRWFRVCLLNTGRVGRQAKSTAASDVRH